MEVIGESGEIKLNPGEGKSSNASNLNNGTSLPFDPNRQHPLRTAWTLWYHDDRDSFPGGKRPPQDKWGEQIKENLYRYYS